jgi:UDP-glucose 4-epimerase
VKLKGARVLITGGMGFLGSNLAHACVHEGAFVTVLDCQHPLSGANPYNLYGLENSIDVRRADMHDTEKLRDCVAKADLIFNCAALTSHSLSNQQPLLTLEANCSTVIHLLESARDVNKKVKIVHLGTSSQVGRMIHSPVDESHPEFPLDAYSASKTAAEKFLIVLADVFGIEAIAVRLTNVFGPRAHIRTANFGFVNYFIGLGMQGKPITVFGGGEQLRNLLFVEDAMQGLIMIAQKDRLQDKVFFLSDSQQISVADIARTIAERIGGLVSHIEWPTERRAIEIGDAVVSSERFQKTFGWRPHTEFQEGIDITRRFYAGCKGKYLEGAEAARG